MSGKYTSKIIMPVDFKKDESMVIIDEAKIQKRQLLKVNILRVLVAIVILLLWEILTRIKIVDSYYWSSPLRIFKCAVVYFSQKGLMIDISVTTLEALVGFISGTVIGAIIGLSFWWSSTYANVSEPYLVILNALPKLSLAPIVIVLFGIGLYSKIVVSFLMTVITCAMSVFAGVKNVDKSTETLLYSLGATKWQVFRKVIIPASMPAITNSLRLNISLAISGAFVGEYISARRGLGNIISFAASIMNNDLIWVGIFIMAILSMILYGIVMLFEKYLKAHWAFLRK